MNFSASISYKLSKVITSELDTSEDKREIIAYAIETGLLFVLGLFLMMLLGYSLNALMTTMIAAAFGGTLRRLSGGAHFSTPLKCLVLGSLMYSFIGVIANQFVNYNFINQYTLCLGLLVSLILVALLAPVDSDAKPIHSGKLKFKLKISSLLFVIIAFVVIFFSNSQLLSVSVVLGVVYQSLTLLPFLNKKGGDNKV